MTIPKNMTTPKKKKAPAWSWKEAPVDRKKPHIEVRYGDARDSEYEAWVPVALVGEPKRNSFSVQWLIDPSDSAHAEHSRRVRKDLDLFLVEEGGQDPWAYAVQHCSTPANMYSITHWAYFPNGVDGERKSSRVVTMSPKEYENAFGKKAKNKKGTKVIVR